MKIVLLGAPGSGKGTQASLISERYGLPHISTGDIFRENIKKGTPVGLKIKSIIDGGDLAPDELTIEIVKERLSQPDCKDGYLLDGFPRNVVQAEALEGFNAPTAVIDIDIPLSKLERRLTGRRSCEKCKSSFHVDFIGETDVCPECGGKLSVRKDDNPESVKERFAVYAAQTEPLIAYFAAKNRLLTVDGDKPINTVFEEITKVLL